MSSMINECVMFDLGLIRFLSRGYCSIEREIERLTVTPAFWPDYCWENNKSCSVRHLNTYYAKYTHLCPLHHSWNCKIWSHWNVKHIQRFMDERYHVLGCLSRRVEEKYIIMKYSVYHWFKSYFLTCLATGLVVIYELCWHWHMFLK